jgi:hypothetical protein
MTPFSPWQVKTVVENQCGTCPAALTQERCCPVNCAEVRRDRISRLVAP